MARREIKWLPTAERRLFAILEYFAERNKSKTYSVKLYRTFNRELQLLNKNPEIGIKTDYKNTRGLIVGNYTLFYEVTHDNIVVHSLWNNRQDPDELIIR
jgi:toxin YoeB